MSAILESFGGVIVAPMQAKDGEWVSSGYLEDEKYSECLPEKASIWLWPFNRQWNGPLTHVSDSRILEKTFITN